MNFKLKWLIFFCSLLVISVSFFVLHNRNYLTEKDYRDNRKDTRVNLVFYKKGCPYCKAGKSEVIKQSRKSKVRTYFIDVETEKGINIARSYHVKYAPTIVVIKNKNYQSFLYARDKDNNIFIEKKKIEEVFRK